MKYFAKFILPIFLIGSVDIIEGDFAEVEVTEFKNGEYMTKRTFLPLAIFPCYIREGDMFYFSREPGVTELRCGEPPD